MRFSVSVPVLSVQITSVEPSVSTALRRLTSAPRRASTLTATASASVMTGSSPSGTLPASRPTANTTLFFNDRPAPKIATGTNATAIAIAIAAISQATLRTWRSSGLGSSLTRSDSAAMRPSSVRIPVANTTPRASSAGGARAAEQEIPRGDPRDARVDQLRRAQRRRRLAVERGQVHLDGTGDQAHVGGDAIALLDEHHVAGDQLGGHDP